jgi:excisionase family DNA binding protein
MQRREATQVVETKALDEGYSFSWAFCFFGGLIVNLDDVDSLATFLHVSPGKIRKDLRETNLPRIRVGKAIRFERQTVLEYLKQQTESTMRRVIVEGAGHASE